MCVLLASSWLNLFEFINQKNHFYVPVDANDFSYYLVAVSPASTHCSKCSFKFDVVNTNSTISNKFANKIGQQNRLNSFWNGTKIFDWHLTNSSCPNSQPTHQITPTPEHVSQSPSEHLLEEYRTSFKKFIYPLIKLCISQNHFTYWKGFLWATPFLVNLSRKNLERKCRKKCKTFSGYD